MVERRALRKTVQRVLVSEFAEYPATGIDRIDLDKKGTILFVLVELHSPSQMNPNQVRKIEDELSIQTKIPTELIVRMIKSTDISSSGSNSAVTAQNLDGFFVSRIANPKIQKIRLSEQVTREFLDDHIGLDLVDVDYLELDRGPTILAMITGIRRLTRSEIRKLESLIRKRTEDSQLGLIIRFINVDLFNKNGPIRYGWSTLIEPNENQIEVADSIRRTIKEAFSVNEKHILEKIHTTITDEGYTFLIEISGPAPYEETNRKQLQEKLESLSEKPVTLYAWVNQGVVLTENGLIPYDELTESHLRKLGDPLKQRIRELLKGAR